MISSTEDTATEIPKQDSSTIAEATAKSKAANFSRLASRLKFFATENVLHAVISFKRPKRKLDYWIPKGPTGWLDYMVEVVGKKIVIQHFTPKELVQVVRRAKIQVCEEFGDAAPDPDLPDCYSWSEKEVGDWLELSGFAYLKEVFAKNHIDGRHLIRVTSNFLIQIGLQDFDERRNVQYCIRSLLGLPMSTSDTLSEASRQTIRDILFEKFLWKRSVTGRSSDHLTFKSFCEERGFTMEELML